MKQYAASPVIQQLVADRGTYFQNGWQDQFYDNVWNVDTAKGFGLDIWGRIVVIGRSLQISKVDRSFGFHEAWTGGSSTPAAAGPVVINGYAVVLSGASPVSTDDRITPFDDAPFYDGIASTETYELSDDAYRKLILAKALANISDCSIPSLNRVLTYLFGSDTKRCYVQTNNRMSMSFVFEFQLDPVEKTIAVFSGVIPRPAGVRLSIVQVEPESTFGFAEGNLQPFDQGVFFGDDGVINAN
uniref:DUF2612 domain-containing protein n=4 Tax=unclassified bacterial viruses TaxID=12333 RepID=A0AAU6W421_9VIRU